MIKIKSIILVCLVLVMFGCANSKSSKGSSEGQSSTESTKLFNVSSYDLTSGDNIQLDYNTTAGAVISFVSSDVTVAEVTETGIVSALKKGSAVIEITLTINGIMQKDTCTINVSDKDITFIGYQNESVTLGINETITPALTILPADITSSGISYQILDTGIAYVDINGAVTGKKAGETFLEASYKSLKTSIKVIVKSDIVNVENITLDCTNIALYQGDTYQLAYEILPPDAANKNVIFTSDNKDAALVYPNGLITAQNTGSAVITAETEDGKKQASCSVVVNESSAQLESIMVDDIVLENGKSKFIKVNIIPENAKFSNIKVQSSSDAVTITNEGRALLLAAAKKQGYAARVEIEAENCEPDANAECYTVFDIFTYDNQSAALPEYLELAEPYNMVLQDGENFKVYMNLKNGDKFNPLAAVNYVPFNSKIPKEDIDILTPNIADNNDVIYYSDTDGLIHAQGVGEGVVQIEVLGNNKIKPVNIFVKVVADESMIPAEYKICPASSITFSNEDELKYNLGVGSRPVYVGASVAHQSGCLGEKVKTYKVETSDKNIIDIIDGYAYAKKAGRAVITVTSNSVYTVDNKPVQSEIEIEVK